MHNYIANEGEHVRLRVHCVLEAGDGKRIAEVKNALLFPDMCAETMIQHAEATLNHCGESQLMAAMRPLIRSHIAKIVEKQRFTRMSRRTETEWAAMTGTSEAMEELFTSLSGVLAKTKADVQ